MSKDYNIRSVAEIDYSLKGISDLINDGCESEQIWSKVDSLLDERILSVKLEL